jgi:hypothetical protein
MRAANVPYGTATGLGTWVRQGNLVFLSCDLRFSATPAGSAGALTITGFPLTARAPAALSVVDSAGIAGGAPEVAIYGSTIRLAQNGTPLIGGDLAYNATLVLSGTFGIIP